MDERRPDIWIVRHGETDWSRRGLHTGRTNVPLTVAGEREAIALRRRFGGRPFALVLSSPLSLIDHILGSVLQALGIRWRLQKDS